MNFSEYLDIRKLCAQIFCLLTYKNIEVLQNLTEQFSFTPLYDKVCLNKVPDIVARMLQKDFSILAKIKSIKPSDANEKDNNFYWCFPTLSNSEEFPDPQFYVIGIFTNLTS